MSGKWEVQKPKKDEDSLPIIARMRANSGSKVPEVMLTIGFLATILAVIFETDALKLTAWGALWTGWNVVWGVIIIRAGIERFTVYRANNNSDGTN